MRASGLSRQWELDAPAGVQVTQRSVPVNLSVRLGSRVDLVVSGAAAFAEVQPDSGPAYSLDGPTDVTAQVFARLLGNRLLARAGVVVPTGPRKLTGAELEVAQWLAHPLLGFQLKQYGRGFDLHLGLAGAVPLGPAMWAGFGVGHTLRGAYELVESQGDYEPAPETAISVGLEFGSEAKDEGGERLLRFDAAYRLFGVDQQNGLDLFEEGNQTELQALARWSRVEGPRAELAARVVLKQEDRTHGAASAEPEEFQPGTWRRVMGSVSLPVISRTRLGLSGEWTGLSGDDRPGFNGNVFGGGPFLQIPLQSDSHLTVGGAYLTGSVDGGDTAGDFDLNGLQLSLGLLWRSGP